MPRSFQSLLTPSTITYNYRIAGNWCGNIFSWFPWIGLQSRENFLWKFIVEMTTCSFTPAKYHEKSEQSQNVYHKNWFFMDFMIFQKDYKFATKFPAIRYTWSIFNNTTESRPVQTNTVNELLKPMIVLLFDSPGSRNPIILNTIPGGNQESKSWQLCGQLWCRMGSISTDSRCIWEQFDIPWEGTHWRKIRQTITKLIRMLL